MNDINFQGGFLIQKPTPKKWENIKAKFPSRKCVFEQFNENGDKFFAIKSCYDKEMAGILLSKKARFKFYPDINLKSRLDSYYPEEARKIVNAQTNVLDTVEQIRQFIKECTPKRKFTITTYRWKPNDHIEKTLKAINLYSKGCSSDVKNDVTYIKGEKGNLLATASVKNGVTYIKDAKGNLLAMASPNNQRGVNFVYVYPTKHSEGVARRFALTEEGETHDFSPLQATDFKQNFLKNVHIDFGRKRPKKNP